MIILKMFLKEKDYFIKQARSNQKLVTLLKHLET